MNAQVDTLQLSHQQRGLVGALICICANTLISFALNVQKLAHIKTQEHEEHDEEARRGRSSEGNHRSGPTSGQYSTIGEEGEGDESPQQSAGPSTKFLRSGLFWWGLSLMVLGEGGNFISYGFAPASLVAPLGSVALLANVFIAPLLLKERFAKSDLFGVALASLGAAGVVAASSTTGDGSSGPNGPDALWNAIKERDFLIYGLVMAVFGCSLAYLSATRWGDKYLLIDVGTCAVFGGFTVLSTKGVSSMLSFGTSRGDILSALKSPLSYGLLFTLVVTAVVQLTFLNRALQRFDARTVVPCQFVFFTISAISGSAVLFRDFERATAGSIAGFLAGCATTFAGVFVLTRQKHDASSHDQGKDRDHSTPSANDQRREDTGKGKVGSSSVPNLPVEQRPLRGRAGTTNERSPLIGSSSRDATTPQRRPAGPIATLTTGSVPISSGEAHLASTSLPNANLRMTPASAARPMMRTPRLSLVGGSAMGAGGYLLLATPGSVGAGGSNNNPNANVLQGGSGGGRSLDGRYRGLSISPTPRTARPAVPQRDIASGSNRGGEDDNLRGVDIDELSSSVTRALSGAQGEGSGDSNYSKSSQQQRRIRNKSSQSDISLTRSLSGGRAGNRYSREFE